MKINELITYMERLTLERGSYHILNKDKLHADLVVGVLQAHPDDEALSPVAHKLAHKGAGVVIVNFTDGSARNIPGYTPEELAAVRLDHESVVAGKKMGAAMVINLAYPDGKLNQYESIVAGQASDIIDQLNLHAVLTTHGGDPHVDHASANQIAKKAVAGRIPLYSGDTITMMDVNGYPIEPTHAFRLSQEEFNLRDAVYLSHVTQTINPNLPPSERDDVEAVRRLPIRRAETLGREGIVYAAVLVQEVNGNLGDPIGEFLKEDRITLRS